ncbi:hypothetical protein BDF19DRAFT_436553 [Syncephalis fuscata]|nr:hypothetical protein BDF19DRAFT_436553 [Syncephalis fuscata]
MQFKTVALFAAVVALAGFQLVAALPQANQGCGSGMVECPAGTICSSVKGPGGHPLYSCMTPAQIAEHAKHG